jgi:U3 small nucleolar RNA-associated protein 4
MKETKSLLEEYDEVTVYEASKTITKFKILSAFLFLLLVAGGIAVGLLWTLPASKSTVSCSSHGIYQTDVAGCQCLECWSGEHCENEVPNCVVDLGLGAPLYSQEYWLQQDLSVSIDFGYRSSYVKDLDTPIPPETNTGIVGLVNQKIRKLHETFGNYNTNDSYLVLGAGGLAIIHAAVFGYSEIIGGPILLYAKPPYYTGFPGVCMYLRNYCTWINEINNSTNISQVVEIVTYPNNPDGGMNLGSSGSPNVIYDLLYYWPMYIPQNYEIQLQQFPAAFFSMSKFSGHSSSRFGWAFVKDPRLALSMANWGSYHYYHVSSDGMRRSLAVIDYILQNQQNFVDTIRNELKKRWQTVLEIFEGSRKFTIISKPLTYFLLVKCNISDCFNFYTQNGIGTYDGIDFGAPGTVRMNIAGANSVIWEIAVERLKKLVNSTL